LTTPRGVRSRIVTAAAIGTAVVVAVSACSSSKGGGGGTSTPPSGTSTEAGATPAKYDLKAAGCPSTVVLQTDWNPESEHGGQYQLLGPNPSINSSSKSVTGELVAHGGIDTGVKLEIRAGGPAIGFQTVTSQLYKDSSISIGYISTDEQIALSKTQPTVAVLAGLEKSPQIIQWSPEIHPTWTTIADIGKTGTKVLYFQGAAYMDYLTGKGILQKSQIDGSYDGTPTNFVASGGKDAVQGFATSEPYTWSHDVRAWDKPMKYQLIADAGFNFYQQAIGVRKDKLAALTPCLTKLVPIMQQAVADFVADPTATNSLILNLVAKYNNGWVYTSGVAAYAVSTMKTLGIIANGTDGTLGSFDTPRMQQLIGILGPIYQAQNKPILANLQPSDLVTNQFVDASIKLP
jgi:hypothetical protein